MKERTKTFSYVLSHDLDFNVRVTINSLESLGTTHSDEDVLNDPYLRYQQLYQNSFAELYATFQIFSRNAPLCMPIKTAYHPFLNSWKWEERIELPVKYCALHRDASLAITLYELSKPGVGKPVGGTTIPLFTENGILRKGKHRLDIWEGVVADGNVDSTTPGKVGDTDRLFVLEKLKKKYERNEMPKLPWLDNLSFEEMEKIKIAEKEERGPTLYIEFPKFDVAVVFGEKIPPLKYDPLVLRGTHDPESKLENLVETKNRLLTRSYRRGHLGKDLKPNATLRNEFNKIIKYPPTKFLTPKEKDLLWKYRYYLSREKKALTFFLKCLDWEDEGEVKQAAELLEKWEPIDVDDALELLSSVFRNDEVRAYAVRTLEKANDEDLLLFLLQLVQALKYDDVDDIDGDNGLSGFLIHRALNNRLLGNYFYWFVCVECMDSEGKDHHRVYSKIKETFLDRIEVDSDVKENLFRQEELVKNLIALANDVKALKGDRIKKMEELKAALADPEGLLQFPPLPLPLQPDIAINGMVPEKAFIFKSAMKPLSLTFKTENESEYKVIFKVGDDLRQDQLIIQLIKLMDQLLRREQLDLKLTLYKVLATGVNTGMVEFVSDSLPVAAVLEDNESVQAFFRKHHNEPGDLEIKAEVMETYVKSCAGYCVITYILGIGDRHLDNLMLCSDGRLFHIDFGFILGTDPKPFAPPFKLTKEMIEGMGGALSPEYKKFRGYCNNAFLILRRSANLILNLFSLMTDASIPDIAAEPDKVVSKVQEKFRLDLDEEDAVNYFESLIDDSLSALFPVVVENIHKYMQYLRK